MLGSYFTLFSYTSKENVRAGLGKAMRYMCTRWLIMFIVLQILSVFLPKPVTVAAFQNNTTSILETNEGRWELKAQDITLKHVLDSINNLFGITISGLENRKTETVNVRIQRESLETVLKNFLRHLGEDNFAFEYHEKKLIHVSIFPTAGPDATEPTQRIAAEPKPVADVQVRTVEVLDVVEGSQAQEIGLKKGDIIVEYDGVRLNRSSLLVAETKKKSPEEQVEILILRDGIPMRFYANGGYIGVRIRSKLVPKNALPNE